MEFFVHTPYERPAAVALGARITDAAYRLGVENPLQELEGVFRRTFSRPTSDLAYRLNYLQPGAFPLEWSFSEADPDALRIELQPFDPDLSPQERLQCTIIELLPLVEARYGKALAAQFNAMAKGNTTKWHPNLKFGSFLGLVVHPNRAPEFKIYVEIGSQDEEMWGASVLGITGVIPHFRSIAVGNGVLSERVYFLCQEGLSLLDLEPLCANLGMRHRFPSLLMMMLDLTDGRFYLPPRSVLLSIRRAPAFTELKVELFAALTINSEELVKRVESLLDPTTVAPFIRWANFVHPEAPQNVAVSIVSIRITASQLARLSVYAAERFREP